MALFSKKRAETERYFAAQTDSRAESGFFKISPRSALCEKELYADLREKVPIIDACIGKIIRLTGGFRAIADDPELQDALDDFVGSVRVGASGISLHTFLDCYLDSLLTYGSALAEMIFDRERGKLSGVYVAPMRRIEIREGKDPLSRRYLVGGKQIRAGRPENLIFTALAPTAESPFGVSVLKGLPAISAILLRIYDCIGQNFDRVGNVRYAVTYKPAEDSGDRAFAAERAKQIAKEWSSGMAAMKNGDVRDFVAVGDVSIKAIGADNQILDTEVPVRQLLEQLISKLGIPPFLLGLNWSTSERMSAQQTDILTSELEYYRRLLEPALKEICGAFLRLEGGDGGLRIEWENINLQDESELALARLRRAQARQIEILNQEREEKDNARIGDGENQ